MADSKNDEPTRDPRSNRIDPTSGQSRSQIKEDAGSGLVARTGEGATSDAKKSSVTSTSGGGSGGTSTSATGGGVLGSATSGSGGSGGVVANSAMQTDVLPTQSREDATFASGDELVRPTSMADTGEPATEEFGLGRPTTLGDGTEQNGETTSTGLPTAMADDPPSGGQSSGAKKMSSVLYSKREVEQQQDPDHLPRGIKEHQSSGARKTYAGISGMAEKHQNKTAQE